MPTLGPPHDMAGLTVTDFMLAGLRNRQKVREVPRPDNPLFDRAFYGETYPDVVKGGIDLHRHFSCFGCRHGYDPNPFFRSAWYMNRYPDVAASRVNPLDHYLDRGGVEGRDPSPMFSSWLYLMLYPDVRASGMNPLHHFLTCGRDEGRRAPPVCLVPSLQTMLGHEDPTEMPNTADARATIALLRTWTASLVVESETAG